MIIRNNKQLEKYQEATKISTDIMRQLIDSVAVGVTPLDIDALADRLCKENKVIPNFKGVGSPRNLYRHATCIAVNDTVLHALPNDVPFKKGDLVKVDFGVNYQGLNTDQCLTVVVGDFISKTDERLLKVARKSVQKAAMKAVAGTRVGDLGYVMESMAQEEGFSVIHEFVGHGIGETLHDDPQIPAFGKKGKGEILREGMVICVESQVIVGKRDVYTDRDGWSIKTEDGTNSAMFEYMVVVGKKKPLFLTKTLDWELVAGK